MAQTPLHEVLPTPTTPAALRRAAQTWPDRIALVDGQWQSSTHPRIESTWTRLHESVRDFAAALVASGIEAGDRVAIWSPNSFHWPIAALGVHYAGATLVPLNTRYTAGEAIEIIERSGARAVVVSGEFLGADHAAELLRDHRATMPDVVIRVSLTDDAAPLDGAVDWDEFLSRAATPDALAEADRRADAVSPDDLSDILFTSGTTGKSKGVLATHRQTLTGSYGWGANAGLGPDDRYLMVNPYFHTFGYKAGILPSVLFGVTMLPLAVYSPDQAMKLVSDERATVFPGAPTIFQTILDDPKRADHDLSSLRIVITGASGNVGTALLIKWLTGPWTPCALTLMFQKEVAERVVAAPGDEAYGRLAVISQAVCEARIVMHLPAAAFTPPPKVASAVVHLTPHAQRPAPERLKRLERVTAAAFGQRRKMLRSSLKPLGGAALCEAAGIEPDARAETIDIAGFLRLAEQLP